MKRNLTQRYQRQLDQCMQHDRAQILRRLRRLQNRKQPPCESELLRVEELVQAATARYARRVQNTPAVNLQSDLPIYAMREEIAEQIRKHPVVIVCGETGSGKTTQLPQICLMAGRGRTGAIGHTQPRRIAARAVAARIAQTLSTPLGQTVGCKIRFRDQTSADTYIKVMTDGILLAETQGDPSLAQYDTIIIDEAHERSLNIDFLLGYLKRLLHKRPTLKVIVTSATIDPQRFARHFENAPIISVTGRTYPVQVWYRPLSEEPGLAKEDRQQLGILQGVDELVHNEPAGDVLVFLSGEREIRETAEALRKHHPPHTQIIPLFARLSVAEQNRIFNPSGARRIVLATNVAETSLTVPGIKYVIDTGLARISRYSYRSKVQRLPIEKISQASAEQRKGRCGRVSEGICIRLYSEQDYLAREPFTDPEIKRTNLAAVILQMKALRLGEVEQFPFVEMPDVRSVKTAYKLLQEIGALDAANQLTAVGRALARLPVDPKLGRILIGAQERNCLREALIIVSGLSVQDPRERPMEKRQQADQAHGLFADAQSDFVAWINLWNAYHAQKKHLSNRKLRSWCEDHYISFLRMREWIDVHSQLKEAAQTLGLASNVEAASMAQLHTALLTGLVANVALRDEQWDYKGAQNKRLRIFPGSVLHKKKPKWIVAAQLIETAQLYAHCVAQIQPEWIVQAVPNLVKRQYYEPCWQAEQGRVTALRRTLLYGLTLVDKETVGFGDIDPLLSRELMIRHGLVDGQFNTQATFFLHNQRLVERVRGLEHKSRKQGILVDEEKMAAFYAQKIPADVVDAKQFEKWRVEVERQDPQFLFYDEGFLTAAEGESGSDQDYPDEMICKGIRLALQYHFEPGHPHDGVTVVIPEAAVARLDGYQFEWLVPGMLLEKLTALIKCLPKSLRRYFVPAPDYALACLQALTAGRESILVAMARHLASISGVKVQVSDWRLDKLPDHLRMRFCVVDPDGRVVSDTRDFATLATVAQPGALPISDAPHLTQWERDDIQQWDFSDLPQQVQCTHDGVSYPLYCALVDKLTSVSIRLFDDPSKAQLEHVGGVRRLVLLNMRQQVKLCLKQMPRKQVIELAYAQLPNFDLEQKGATQGVEKDPACWEIINAALQVMVADGVYEQAAFHQLVARCKPMFIDKTEQIARLMYDLLEQYRMLEQYLKQPRIAHHQAAIKDIRGQLAWLIYRGFVAHTPAQWLTHLPRFLQAIERRIQKIDASPNKDAESLRIIAPLWQAYQQRLRHHLQHGIDDAALTHYRWMLEEFRVSLFAQELRTSMPVSIKRLNKQWEKVA